MSETVTDSVVEEENGSKTEKILSIVNIVVNSIFYVFIFILLMFSITQITGKSGKKVPNVFGLGYESVQSGSMNVPSKPTWAIVDEGRHKNKKDSFDKGDLVWVKTLNSKERKKLHVGDIATFWDTQSPNPTSNKKGFLNTHRVVDIIKDSNGKTSSYVFQGDIWRGSNYDYKIYMNANSSKSDSSNQQYLMGNGYIQIIGTEDVKAQYIGHWEGAGNFVDWLSNPKKGFVVIILFAGAFMIFEAFMVVKNVMALRTEKMGAQAEADKQAMKDEMKKSMEEERERMRQELLAEIAAQNAAKDSGNEEADAPDEMPEVNNETPEEESSEDNNGSDDEEIIPETQETDDSANDIEKEDKE